MKERKEAKIRQAQEERERKELEECTFAPQVNRKKRYKPMQTSVDEDLVYAQTLETEEVRDVDTFVADQQKFLAQKQYNQEVRKNQMMVQEETKKN